MSEFTPSHEIEKKVRDALAAPDARPEFVNQLRNELARRPMRMKSHIVLKPVWLIAMLLLIATLTLSTPQVATAIKQLFGYVPGVGLVETTYGLRMLAEPVSVTREGVTVTITQALVYEDRLELAYEVDGIVENYNHQKDMCLYHPDDTFWSDGDADLRLPDGTIVRRDYAGEFQFENRYAMKPVYAVKIPMDVNELTMVLKCLPFTKLGAAPENWEVPFSLIKVPAGTVIGEPVIEVEQPTQTPTASPQTEEPVAPSPVVRITLEKIVPTDTATIFYISMSMEDPDPSLVSILPIETYLIDVQGTPIQLRGNFPMQPFQYRTGSLLEFISTSKPADGPLTLVVENAIAHYAPLYVEPRQATPEEMYFTFDAGADPQRGQVWELDDQFLIAGYQIQITSARAVIWDDVEEPSYIDGSQGFDYGYQFSVQGHPAVKMTVDLDLLADNCGFTVGVPFIPEGSSLLNTQLCRGAYPTGTVTAYIRQIAVLLEGPWQATWTPTAQ